ncbi:FecR domain-containing protein [Methylobacillus gramineus]|uniref:FecR family protein n=1 Tax=Methylobacillus gramineus TaxID=755169 RepID=UPI001CFF9ED7|nr:FecR domain-containing protein [Methylobacillus gramineus]MCB5184864.1 FecR domain-containing protein [Methylobacillus gramineus]
MTQHHTTPLVKHALTLLARMEIEPEASARAIQIQLAAWRNLSGMHEAAYQEACRQLESLSTLAPQLRQQFDEPAASRTTPRKQRQSLLAWGALTICCAALVKAGIWYWHQPVFEADYQTDIAQIREVSLPDGSKLAINAKSHLHVALYRQKRLVSLDQGEARFEVSPNKKRPFHVETRAGDVEVIGTIFTVRDRGTSVTVNVEQGHVRFHHLAPENSAKKEIYDLVANEQLLIKNGTVSLGKAQAQDASAWRSGWLVFNDTHLEDAVPVINAFRHQPLTLADEATARLRLTGRFRTHDQHSLEQALPAILPVTIQSKADHTLTLKAK